MLYNAFFCALITQSDIEDVIICIILIKNIIMNV